jgi:hypothetical protein
MGVVVVVVVIVVVVVMVVVGVGVIPAKAGIPGQARDDISSVIPIHRDPVSR